MTTASAVIPPNPSIESDPKLIARCLVGDQAAWTALVGRYNRLVFAVARRAGLSQEDAEDTFQVVFTTLYRRLAGLRDQERLAAWLITTTHREAVRARRRLLPQRELGEEIPTDEEPIDVVVERETQRQMVREAMAALDNRCDTLLRALFLESDQSYVATAQRLGIAVGSIGPIRARCLARLRTILNERGFSPQDVP